jgi:ribosome-binding protein aMBF1 (putative translation factor)
MNAEGGDKMDNVTILTNTKMLDDAIRRSGLKKGYLADQIGVSRTHFNNVRHAKAELRGSQIKALCTILGIGAEEMNAIFFNLDGA